jgi:hypothetical protein
MFFDVEILYYYVFQVFNINCCRPADIPSFLYFYRFKISFFTIMLFRV